ncbi:TPA: hypothetical protein TUV11_001704 [Streptococcus equi subsp. zooepidemicus]|nr:hypothetical protein [Streptococcus equi subsp. zooepidemicus]
MKKLVLASAAALVLAGAVVGTGEVRAEQPWRVPSWYLRSSSSKKYKTSKYSRVMQHGKLTADQKSILERKEQGKNEIDTLTLADQQKYDFKKKIDSVKDYTIVTSILAEARLYSNTNKRFLQKCEELYRKYSGNSYVQEEIEKIKKDVEYDAGYSAQQGINDLNRLENSF